MTTLEDRLDAIKHNRLRLDPGVELHERSCHRPDFSAWGSFEADQGGGIVSLSMSALMGEPQRFASLTPFEARQLARLLTEAANAVEAACTVREPAEAE